MIRAGARYGRGPLVGIAIGIAVGIAIESDISIAIETAGRRAMTAAASRAGRIARRRAAVLIEAAALACLALLVVSPATGAGALAQTAPATQDKSAPARTAPDKTAPDKPAPDKPGRDGAAPDKTVARRAKGPPGKDIRIAVYVNVKPDCSSGPMPTIRLVGAPAHGTVTVRKATIKATNVRECLALEVPGFVALYRSRPGFAGADIVSLEVRFPDKPPQVHEIAITIADGGERI